MSDTSDKIVKWFLLEDTGVSSEAIVSHLTGFSKHGEWDDHPCDSGDFGRCYNLLSCVPEFQSRITEMSSRSKQWAELVKHWAELSRRYEANDKTLYPRIKEILSKVPNKNTVDLGNGMSISFK